MRLKGYLTEEKVALADIIDTIHKDCKPILKEIQKAKKFVWRGSTKYVLDMKKVTHRQNRRPGDTPQEIHDHINKEFKRTFGWPARSGVFATGSFKEAKSYGAGCLFFPIGKFNFVWSPNIPDFFTEVEGSDYINYEAGNGGLDDWKVEEEWDDEYGQGNNGVWSYDGQEVSSGDRNDIIEELDLLLSDFDRRLLKWIPDVTYDEYWENEVANWEQNRDEYYDGIVEQYVNRNIVKAIHSDNEIMFQCKEYYLVNERYSRNIMESITGKGL